MLKILTIETIRILKATIHNLSMRETLDLVSTAIASKNQLHHVVVNAGKIVAMQKDEALRKSVNESDIINADGQAVVWAAKILGKPLKERVAGSDLFENLVHMAHEQGHSIFLLGAKEEVVTKVSQEYQEKYNPNIINIDWKQQN